MNTGKWAMIMIAVVITVSTIGCAPQETIIDHSKNNEEILQARMYEAMILIDANDETAFNALLADLKSHPKACKLLFDLGNQCELFRHNEHAEAVYCSIIEVDPDCDAAVIFERIGWALFAQRLYKQAITEYSKTVELYPDSKWAPISQYWIGQSYYRMRDFDRALVEYQKVIDNYSDIIHVNHARRMIAIINR
jgi:tetratricopeptide (TPR) repeat protein